MKVQLPPKENALYKRIVKCYEHKLYKNGLKFAKQILSQPQFADHAETLAMKGLILNALGRRAEATDLVRRGLKNNLGSSTCWHVYGLIQRSEKKYDEVIKCFRNALKWDPSNLQILRELSLVQIHTRDLIGFRDTRHQLFKIKPTQRASWLGFAISYHLLQDYEMAYKIAEAFTKSCYRDFQPEKRDAMATFEYEKSELYLYQSMILHESGDVGAARKHMLDHSTEITDKITYYETVGKYHLELEEYGQAESVYRKLISFNPDNRFYYDGLMKSLRIEDGTTEKVNVYKEIQVMYPKAGLAKRLALECVDGEEFEALLEPYVINAIFRGAVTLFTDLEPLYKNPQKVEIIENLMIYLIDNMERFGKFEERDVERAPVTSLLWSYYYLAKHYDRLGQTKTALKYIDIAIEHTPTLNDLYICKSKIYKHAGDYPAAVECMNEARDMDTADRYINSKCAKYMMRANLVDDATEILGKFTREGANPIDNLNEMQCMWFLTEAAAAYQRQGRWGEALKKCLEIERHFNDILDDQYDFHTYCIRKMTLRSYVKLLRLEDVLHAHPFYFKAAQIAINVYLYLYDNPLKSQSDEEQLNTENLSPAELKKLRNKQRKAKKKAELEQQSAAAIAGKKDHHQKSKQSSEEGDSHTPSSTDELVPEKLVVEPNPLEQAIRFLKPLQSLAAQKVETHIMAYEIYSRRDKPLLMLRSIRRALKVDSENDVVQKLFASFKEAMAVKVTSLPEPLSEFMCQELDKLGVA
ncbi:unnamed protein product [Orchesella dallaii]|uniref:N-alpha-acetyltransferase 15, NatA auxiliary subunit n=1 Tax=Orchesella dallaii TaxID=48710 RepID=A0ABP1R362_9HEXA